MFNKVITKLALWWIGRVKKAKVDTTEGFEKFKVKQLPTSVGEANFKIFVAYEAGRARLLREQTIVDA